MKNFGGFPLLKIPLVFWILCTWIFFVVDGSKEEYAMSLHEMEKLAVADMTVVTDLIKFQNEFGGNEEKIIKIDEDFKNEIAGYLQDFEESTGIQIKDEKIIANGWSDNWMKMKASEMVENPISAYRLIRRTALVFPLLVEKAPKELVFSSELVKKKKFPDKKDITAAIDGIFRLTLYYKFKESEVADGVIGGTETGVKLNAVHCFEIGVRLGKINEYLESFAWLRLALKKAKSGNDKTMGVGDLERIYQEFEKIQNQHDEMYEESMGDSGFGPRQSYLPLREPDDFTPEGRVSAVSGRNFGYFRSICRGNNHQSEEEKSRLFCWREFAVHPIYRIGPLKIEFLSRNPDIVQIYEFLGHESIEWMKAQETNFRDSTEILTAFGSKDIYAPDRSVARIQMVIGLNDPPQELKILRLIGQATGLRVIKDSTAEKLVVGSYNFLGHYTPHVDSPGLTEENYRPRVATFLIYLSETKSGGGGITGFSAVGVGARPIKGSAIFWHNLLLSGNGDFKTLHGSCPPILSRKIIGQLWIKPYQSVNTKNVSFLPLNNGQESDRYKIKVNGRIHK